MRWEGKGFVNFSHNLLSVVPVGGLLAILRVSDKANVRLATRQALATPVPLLMLFISCHQRK